MKKAISVFAQLVLFLAVFLVGSLADPFHLKWFVTHPTPTSTKFFVPDGLLLTLVLYGLILVVQMLRGRVRTAAPWSVLALGLALALGFVARFGFVQQSLF